MFALVKNGVVQEVKDMTSEEVTEVFGFYENIVDVTNGTFPGVGWVFDGAGFVAPPGFENSSMKITKLAFVERLTQEEYIGIIAFSRGTGPLNLAVESALRRQALAIYIDLSLTATITGVGNLVALGLLTSDRATTILTTPPTDFERYKGQQ